MVDVLVRIWVQKKSDSDSRWSMENRLTMQCLPRVGERISIEECYSVVESIDHDLASGLVIIESRCPIVQAAIFLTGVQGWKICFESMFRKDEAEIRKIIQELNEEEDEEEDFEFVFEKNED